MPLEGVNVVRTEIACLSARHRVGVDLRDVRAGSDDRLADVLRGAQPSRTARGGGPEVRECGPAGAAAIVADLVTGRGMLLLVDLPPALERGVGRLRRAASVRGRERGGREGKRQKPHHPRVNSTAAL